MDNKSCPKIEAGYEQRITALEEENESLKMKIESLEQVNILEEKSMHTKNWLLIKSPLSLVHNIIAFFRAKFLKILA